jgi:hypothetical protein
MLPASREERFSILAVLLQRLDKEALVTGGNVVERPMRSESTESVPGLATEGGRR